MPIPVNTMSCLNRRTEADGGDSPESCDDAASFKFLPYVGTYQLTFLNRFSAGKDELARVFGEFENFVKVTGKTGADQRGYAHYRTDADASKALDKLRNDARFMDLEVADKCRGRLGSSPAREVQPSDPSAEAILPFQGTYQITFSTGSYVRMEGLKLEFSKYGALAAVEANFHRSQKNRVRVFVKYFRESEALSALDGERHRYEDIEVAHCCKPKHDKRPPVRLTKGEDGFYCLAFRVVENRCLTKKDIFQKFFQFGSLQNIRQDSNGWCYVRYSDESSARDAYNRYSICDQFPGFGPASEPKHAAAGGAADVGQPAGGAPPSGLELYVGNYPHRMGRRGLKKVFGAFPFPKLRFIGFHREGRRAYCFAEADSRETFEAVLRTMNGAEVSGRRLVVRATAPAAVQADGERTEGGRRQAGQAADVPFDDFVRVAVANYPAGAEGRLEELLLPYDPVSILKNEEEEEEEEVQCCIALFRTDSDADMAVKHLNQVLFMSSYVLLLKKLSDCTEE